MFLLFVAVATLLIGITYASFFEWTLHRFPMHHPIGFIRYPFEAHARTHHRLFKADDSYHCTNPALTNKISMAWWNVPLVVGGGWIAFWLAAVPFTIAGLWSAAWLIIGIGFAICIGYYVTYERIHWCMHLPKDRRLERTALFRRLNGHHILHHRFQTKNFNVVLPIADWVLGTLLTRAPYPFAQARGPMIPDVQPAS